MHALKEGWRVLAPQGIMVDVRPLSVDVPLEIISKVGSEPAGMVDMSPDLPLDIAANRAIDTVIDEQVYKETFREYFDFAFYWRTIRGMKADIKERWKDEVIISEEVWSRAAALVKRRRGGTKIRMAMRMKLGIYEKQ